MQLLLESPLTILGLGIALAVVCLMLAAATGRRALAWGAVGVLITAGVLTAIERSVVTPREEIQQVLHQIADDLVTNDVDRITRHISYSQVDLIAHARRLIPQYSIHQAKVKNNVQVEFPPNQDPRHAVARFNAVLRISETRGSIKNLISPWYFVVEFVREQGNWRAIRYERHDPREGLRRRNL